MRSVHTQVHAKKYCIIWIDLPKSGRAVPPRKWAATMREFALWIRSASSSKVPAVLYGWRGKQWQYEALAALLTDNIVTESKHALCHYELPHVDEEGRAAFHMYSTFPVAGGRCHCQTPVTPTNRKQTEITTEMYKRLIPKITVSLQPGLDMKPESQ